jgi:DNA-binding NtrC family response regulator
VDLIMPGMSGVDFLRHLREFAPELPAIVVSATDDLDQAIAAFREQPFDFLRKPVQSRQLTMAVERALGVAALRRQVQGFEQALSGEGEHEWATGPSRSMREFWSGVRQAAVHGGDTPVLVTGESGTGKELVARAVHQWGPREKKPFVTVNCGALGSQLSASILFGIGRGVATGVEERAGKFEVAQSGTIFLDEIGDLHPGIQVQLLRILQERVFTRVGSHRELRADVRVIAATNSDLRESVKLGTFRQDLFYRLNVLTFHVPPLRERPEDIPSLVKYFLHRHGRANPQQWLSLITKSLIKTLQSYDWPGNVRQLENVITHMIITGERPTVAGLREASIAPSDTTETRGVISVLDRSWSDIEREILMLNMQEFGGNLVETANALGIPKSTLYDKIHRLGIR